jgi:hypothetical protein
MDDAHGALSPSGRRQEQIKKILAEIWREMHRYKRHHYELLRAWVEAAFENRDELSSYLHGVYRGFWADWSKRLGITPNGVKKRLIGGIKWFAGRIRTNALAQGTEEAPSLEEFRAFTRAIIAKLEFMDKAQRRSLP